MVDAVELEGLEARDADGNVLFLEDPTSPGDIWDGMILDEIQNDDGTKTVRTVSGDVQGGYVFSSKSGKHADAYYMYWAAINVKTYDSEGNLLKSSSITVYEDGKLLDESYAHLLSNCHGFSISGSGIWINDPEILLEDDYQAVNSSDGADVLLFTDQRDGSGIPYHSAKVNSNGTYAMKDGFYPFQTNLNTIGQAQGKYSGTYPVFYKKTTRDVKLNIQKGEVLNGIRVIHPERPYVPEGGQISLDSWKLEVARAITKMHNQIVTGFTY